MAAKTKTGAQKARSTRADRAEREQKKTEEGSRSGVRFVFDDDLELVLDLNTLTVGEQVELEEWLGMPMGRAQDDGWIFSSKASAKLAHIARRRKEPGFTFGQVLDATELKVEFAVPPTKTPEDDGSKD